MPTTFNLYDAKTRLSELVDRAAAGEEIVIAKHGKPLARLLPMPTEKPARQPGGWEGLLWVADDFDAPLPPDLQRYFDGETGEDEAL
jgi:prevent-host-death family protein